ncbi:MAG: rod shape-determining protein MreD [Treponema sp.]|nr:rod shape-determining protein MreD [Treponema sp.]
MAKSFFVSTLILFFTAILESSIFTNISFLIVVPDFLLMCSIYFSLLNGKLYGEISGFTSGLFLDFITGAPLGLNCLLRTITGYVFGLFSETVIISGIIMPVLSVGCGTLLKRLILIVIGILYPSCNINIYGFISTQFLFEFCANVLLAPLVFFMLGYGKNILSINSTKDKIDNA